MSKNLIDGELEAIVRDWPKFALNMKTLTTAREQMNMFDPGEMESLRITRTRTVVTGRVSDSDVPVIIYRPAGSAGEVLPCILHIHGGGYVMGFAGMMEHALMTLADQQQCVIATVDYRLAPETPYPGPVEDCYTALGWIIDEASSLGIDPACVGVMGESAGGGLAAALALLARDRGKYRLAFQHLIYPMLDDRTCVSAQPHPHTGHYIWTRNDNHFGWLSYLGATPGSEAIPPYAAPARATDLAGLPPAFIATGALDLFLEEDLEYARRLTRAGVSTELHVYPGAVHGFDIMSANVSRRALRDSGEALARALRPEK